MERGVSHPDDFLIHVYYLNPQLVVHVLHEQAAEINRSLETQLSEMKKGLPQFVQVVSEALLIIPSTAVVDERDVSLRTLKKHP